MNLESEWLHVLYEACCEESGGIEVLLSFSEDSLERRENALGHYNGCIVERVGHSDG